MTVIHKTPQTQIQKSSKQDPNAIKMANTKQPYDKYKYVPKNVMEVAEGMESQFTNHLLREMKKVSGQKLGPAENIYQSMLDSERSKMMAKSNSGLGIKDVVIRELYPQFQQVDYRQRQNNESVRMHKEIKPQPKQSKVEMYKKVNSQQGERL